MGRLFSIGEALIDFIPLVPKTTLAEVEAFAKRPGGAPANVAVAAAKLGSNSYFVGKVGDDPFGHFMIDTIEGYGVNVEQMHTTKKAKTALAFVTLGENGARDFSFYRNPSADLLLDEDDVKDIHFTKGDFVNFGTVDLVDWPVRKATEFLLKRAKAEGATVLFDPNIRKDLWDDLDDCKRTIIYFSKYADIFKMADDEIGFITGKTSVEDAVDHVQNTLHVPDVIITLGAKGSEIYTPSDHAFAPSYSVHVIDTTGAGDSFVGAFLNRLDNLGKKTADVTQEEWTEILSFANLAAAMVCEQKGAMNAAPTMRQIMERKAQQ